MDAMRSSDHERFFMLEGLLLQDLQKAMDVLEDDFRGFFQKQSEGSIQDVGGGETVMEIFR